MFSFIIFYPYIIDNQYTATLIPVYIRLGIPRPLYSVQNTMFLFNAHIFQMALSLTSEFSYGISELRKEERNNHKNMTPSFRKLLSALLS